MTLIQAQTLSTSAASVTFSSIPQTYKSLRLVISARSDATYVQLGYELRIAPNGSSANAFFRQLYGNGTAPGSNTDTNIIARSVPSDYTSNTFSSSEIIFPNYSSAANKVIAADAVNENNASTAVAASLLAQLWSNTQAISSLVFSLAGGNFVSGSSFYLYGIN